MMESNGLDDNFADLDMLRIKALKELDLRDTCYEILNQVPIPFWRKDLNFRYTFTNGSLGIYTGKGRGYCLGKTDYEVWSKEIADGYRKNDLWVIENKRMITTCEGVPAKEDKSSIEKWWIRKFPSFDSAGNVDGVWGLGIRIERLILELQANEQYRQSV